MIGVPPFESQVPRSEVVELLTQEVTREFITRGGFEIKPGRTGVDAVVDGNVTGLTETPTAFDSEGRAIRSILTITASVTMTHSKSNETLYENPGFSFRAEIELDPDSDDLFFDRESEGIEDIARRFARTLVATIVEGF